MAPPGEQMAIWTGLSEIHFVGNLSVLACLCFINFKHQVITELHGKAMLECLFHWTVMKMQTQTSV